MAREESQRGIQHDVNVYVHGLDGHKSRRLEPKHLSSLKSPLRTACFIHLKHLEVGGKESRQVGAMQSCSLSPVDET